MSREILTEHCFHLETDSPVTAESLAQSLIGLDGVIRRSGDVLKLFLGDVARVRTEVLIKSVEVASYKENFFVRLVLGKGRTLESKIEEIRTTLNLKNMDAKTLLKIVVGILILYVAWKSLKPGDPATIHIENSFNNYGRELNLTREQMIALIEGAVTNKQDLKKHVIKLVHPGGDIHSGSLKMDGDENLIIPSEVVRAIPPKYDGDDREEPFDDKDNISIAIRAVDLDRPEHGWAAIVPEISDRRLPVRVSESLETAKIPIGRYVQADITVIYRIDRNGYKSPIRYHLRKLRLDELPFRPE